MPAGPELVRKTHLSGTSSRTEADDLAVMTPEVAALVEALHAPDLAPEAKADVWRRHNSAVVAG